MRSARLVLIVAALASLAARPVLRNWGSTLRDRTRLLPGDGLVPGERGVCTMAIDIDAPAAAVWPWLAQMGNGRAGWYSWDRLDNGGKPSARSLEPRWVDVQKGDRLITVPGRSWFDVAHVEPNRSLVLRASLDLLGRPFDVRQPWPRAFIDSRWEFFLDPQPGGTVRLLVRSGGIGKPWPLVHIIDYLFWHAAHVVMQRRQLSQIRERVEQHGASLDVPELRREFATRID